MKLYLGLLMVVFLISSCATPQRPNRSQTQGANNTKEAKTTKTSPRVSAQSQTIAPSSSQSVEIITPLQQLASISNSLQTELKNISSVDSPNIETGFEIIERKLTADELESVTKGSYKNIFKSAAFFRLGEFELSDGDSDNAKEFFASSYTADSTSSYGIRAKMYLDQIEAAQKVEPMTIGVVLPLSGRSSAVAERTLRGIQMGLGLYNNQASPFKLAVIDSEGNPDIARRGVDKLVKQDNVIAIIGSILSKEASAIAARSEELKVPSISLSQKSGVTEIGESVFRNALTSEMQVRFLVKHSMEKMGLKRFAIIYPNDPYGVEYANIFWDEVLARGGSITAVQTYHPKETDFTESVKKLVGTYYVNERADEYRFRLKDWQDNVRKSVRQEAPLDLLPPVVNFEAVFIPDSVRASGQIAAMLSFTGVKSVKLLGTNLWNNPELPKRMTSGSNEILFVDTFATEEQKFQNSGFVRDYKILFGQDPSNFEVLGYDTALLLRSALLNGASSRKSLTKSLQETEFVPGAVGSFSLYKDREFLRPMSLMKLDKGVILPVNN